MGEGGGPLFSAQCAVVAAHPFICPTCGADYPAPGTCYGFKADKHEPQKVEQR